MDFAARLYAAAVRVPGMCHTAVVTPSGGVAVEVPVGFAEPTEMMLGGEVIADSPGITFPTASLPTLARGAAVTVAGRNWRVKTVERLADGSESRATLERMQ